MTKKPTDDDPFYAEFDLGPEKPTGTGIPMANTVVTVRNNRRKPKRLYFTVGKPIGWIRFEASWTFDLPRWMT